MMDGNDDLNTSPIFPDEILLQIALYTPYSYSIFYFLNKRFHAEMLTYKSTARKLFLATNYMGDTGNWQTSTCFEVLRDDRKVWCGTHIVSYPAYKEQYYKTTQYRYDKIHGIEKQLTWGIQGEERIMYEKIYIDGTPMYRI